MILEICMALLFAVPFGYMVLRSPQGTGKLKKNPLLAPKTCLGLLLGGALLLRLFIGYFATGFGVDITLFKAWGELCNQVGFGKVYFQDALYLDYPPGYLYILAFLDGLRGLMGIAKESDLYTLMIKLPSILADLGVGYVLYRACKNRFSTGHGIFVSAAYLFCPAVLINSAVWGQLDGLCVLVLFGACYLLYKTKILPSAIVYGIAVAIKPQMMIFAPIFLFVPLLRKQYCKTILGVGTALLTLLVIALPFTQGPDFSWLIKLYQSTVDYYAYYTINAYNFWGMIGQNWAALPADSPLLAALLTWGVPVLATALCGVYLFRVRTKYSLFFAPALLMATVFLFAVKMHERYLFPVLFFVLLTYVFTKDRRLLWLFGGFATVHFLNVAYVLYLNNTFISSFSPEIILLSAAHLALYGYLLYWGFWGHKTPAPVIIAPQKLRPVVLEPEPVVDRAMYKKDYLLAGGIALVYAVFAFWGLGANQTANTAWEPAAGEAVVIQLPQESPSMTYLRGIGRKLVNNYASPKVGSNISVAVSTDGQSFQEAGTLESQYQDVYMWKEFALPAGSRYVRLTALDSDSILNEVAFQAGDKQSFLTPAAVSGNGNTLVDEQKTVPLRPSYYTSTYFDEIYHARTAYEHILGVEPYESTHPPLGKLIIAAAIQVFGMNPFGWRFAGALLGVLMLPVFYHILKRLFGKTDLAAAGMLLFAFDFMHFTQTRIATIDTYAVFFLLLMYDAMLVFVQKDLKKSTMKELLLPLALSGIFMGLGIASKWTCAYGAVGLAVLLFAKLIINYKKTADAEEKRVCMNRTIALCLWCVLLFITIPFAIYFVAFLPMTLLPQNSGDVFGRFVNYQTHMFNYHSGLVAEHSFASPWYEWPLTLRSMWYNIVHNVDGNGAISTISAMGNPLLWWSGFAALLWSIWAFAQKRQQALGFLLTGFGAVFLPWVLVSRLTFIYHYFTAVPFVVIALVYCMGRITEKNCMQTKLSVHLGKQTLGLPLGQLCLWGFVAVNFALFLLFYPVISGAPTSNAFAQALEWLPKWLFV